MVRNGAGARFAELGAESFDYRQHFCAASRLWKLTIGTLLNTSATHIATTPMLLSTATCYCGHIALACTNRLAFIFDEELESEMSR